MTNFSDNIYTGAIAAASSLSSMSPVMLSRTMYFSGSGNITRTCVLPPGTQNLDAQVYIMNPGSAGTNSGVTVSADNTRLISASAFGSAAGLLNNTSNLGTLTNIAVNTANLSLTAPTSVQVVVASKDETSTYAVELLFNRADGT